MATHGNPPRMGRGAGRRSSASLRVSGFKVLQSLPGTTGACVGRSAGGSSRFRSGRPARRRFLYSSGPPRRTGRTWSGSRGSGGSGPRRAPGGGPCGAGHARGPPRGRAPGHSPRRRPAPGWAVACACARVERRVRHDLQEPGPEPAPAVEVVQVDVGLQEPLLHRVMGVMLVPQEAVGHAVGDAPVAAEELLAGRAVALTRQGDEGLVGRRSRRWGPRA